MNTNKLMYRAQVAIFVILATFFVSSAGWATTYYVSAASGNDANAGTSAGMAWKTIQKAANSMRAGDTTIVTAGMYNERVQVTNSGSAGALITCQAQGTVVMNGFTIIANYIKITGFEITTTLDNWKNGAGVHIEGAYNDVENNYIHNTARIGIQVFASPSDSPTTHDNLVKNNTISYAGYTGINVYGANNIIESNDISHSLQHPPGNIISSTDDADGIRFFGTGHIIRKNTIHDILLTDPGTVDAHIDCFQTWGPAYNIVFEQNFCDNPNDCPLGTSGCGQGWMISEVTSPVRDLTIRNNVVKAFRLLNVHNAEHTIIVNNSFKSELFYTAESQYGIELHNSPNCKVQNNLFYDVGRHVYPYITIDTASNVGVAVGYNAAYMSDGIPPVGSPMPNDLWQKNPQLVNIAASNFQPQATSPLINVGITLAEVTNDRDGVVRPQGSGHDIGAFEFGLPSAPTNLTVMIW